MHKELFEEFRRLEGQPVRIYTDDSRIIQGIVFCAGENSIRVLLENGDVALVAFCHIDTVEQPMMRLRRPSIKGIDFCRSKHCHERGCFDFEDECDCCDFDDEERKHRHRKNEKHECREEERGCGHCECR